MVTDKQQKYIDAVAKHGGIRAAAAALGVCHSTVGRALKAAARKDPSLHTNEAPEGYLLRGVSTLVDADGNVKQQWVKTKADKEEMCEALRAAVDDIADEGRGALPPLAGPKVTNADLLAAYTIADPHFGLLTWRKETGQNFDLKKAEQQMKATFDQLVATAQPADEGLLLSLGDFFHSDGEGNQTARGTHVDVDGRFPKIAVAGVRILRYMIDRLLERHGSVTVKLLAGNHDENQSVWLAIVLAAMYENEPRVVIDVDPRRFQVHEFGKNLIGVAHGHTIKLPSLPGVMAADWPKEWGRTKHRYWYVGHVHHDSRIESMGCAVETVRTIAPNDAWHTGKGYRAGRDLKCDIYHRDNGRIARVIQGVI